MRLRRLITALGTFEFLLLGRPTLPGVAADALNLWVLGRLHAAGRLQRLLQAALPWLAQPFPDRIYRHLCHLRTLVYRSSHRRPLVSLSFNAAAILTFARRRGAADLTAILAFGAAEPAVAGVTRLEEVDTESSAPTSGGL